jgi:hypothetical protein
VEQFDVGGQPDNRCMGDFVEEYTGRVRHVVDCAHCGARVERYVWPGQQVRYCTPRCGDRARDKLKKRRRKSEERWNREATSRASVDDLAAWIAALQARLQKVATERGYGRCPATRKIMYPTSQDAWVAVLYDFSDDTMNAFPCAKCGSCHLGNSTASRARAARQRASMALEAAALRL